MAYIQTQFPPMQILNQEISSALLSIDKIGPLKEALSLSNRVTKICATAEKICDQKVQNSAQDVFQKSGAEALIHQGKKFFQKLEENEKIGIARDRALLKEIQEISYKAEDLNLQFILLSPEDLVGEINALALELKQLSEKESYNQELIDEVVFKVLDKIRHLQFRLDFPVVEELCLHSYQNNFARQLTGIAEDLQKGKKESFALLSEKQRKSIQGFVQKNSLSQAVLRWLQSLQELTHLAERFLYHEPKKAVEDFRRLDEKTKKAIDQYLFASSGEMFGSLQEEITTRKNEANLLCAAAIMAYVNDQVMDASV